jgi:hypothetical protein
MHPIERLRYVARAAGGDGGLAVRAAAGALTSFADDPAALVTACRRLVDRQPACGPMWWLAARVLAAADPRAEAWRAVAALDDDPTPHTLTFSLPEDATVLVVGWPDQVAEGLRPRGDLRVLVLDADGEGSGFARRLTAAGLEAELIVDNAVGPAVVASDVVVLEATAVGPDGFVARTGSRAAAAVARTANVPVWVVAGVGRVLPGRLWQALVARLAEAPCPWERDEEIVPLTLADQAVRPDGLETLERAVAGVDCPVAPELLREMT